jgi:membrane associated rhomboid family serine protease
MSEFERKFGKYAVRDLSLKLIILYLAGYALYYLNSQIIFYMTLNPYAIVHGQIWRIFSWLLIPPSTSNLFFVAVMMFFYYSIGTSLERVWGTWRYNVFIFTGILLTVAASFVWMGFSYLTAGSMISSVGAAQYFGYYSMAFSTYYINMGIFFAYALTFPDAVVLMFFIIPMKIKHAIWIFVALDVLFAGSGDTIAHFTHLGGIASGFLCMYLFDNSIWDKLRGEFKERRKDKPAGTPDDPLEGEVRFMDRQKQLDMILKKVSEGGVNSLTEAEKTFLVEESARRRGGRRF